MDARALVSYTEDDYYDLPEDVLSIDFSSLDI